MLQFLQLMLMWMQGLILMRTERWVKIIINANFLVKLEEVVKPALERSNSFQFSLAHIIKLGAWLIHHYNISDLKQHNFDCRTVPLIEKPKGCNCGTDFSFLKISLFYVTYRNFMLQCARLHFICWKELTLKLNELFWSWECARTPV